MTRYTPLGANRIGMLHIAFGDRNPQLPSAQQGTRDVSKVQGELQRCRLLAEEGVTPDPRWRPPPPNTVLLLRTGKSHQVRPSTIVSRNDQVNPITRPRSTAASAC